MLNRVADWARCRMIERGTTLDEVVQALRQTSCASAFRGLAADFQEIHNEHSHLTHGHLLAVRELSMRLRVENEKTADIDFAISGYRRSGIESKVRIFLHDRKRLVSIILAQIG
jgi:hypothetical protein